MKWKSIIQKDPSVSYLSGAYGVLHKHHCLHGPYRSKAEKDGLYVMLLAEEHRRLHDNGDYDLELKQVAQRAWMEKTGGSIDDFRRRYGINYI